MENSLLPTHIGFFRNYKIKILNPFASTLSFDMSYVNVPQYNFCLYNVSWTAHEVCLWTAYRTRRTSSTISTYYMFGQTKRKTRERVCGWTNSGGRADGCDVRVLHLWRPSNFAANLASLHLLVSSQCPIFHQRGRGRRLGRPPFTWSRFTCGGLSPSCPMSGYPQAMSAGPGPTCRAGLAPRELYIQMHRYCRPRIFEFRCQTRPKFYFKARRARKMMEKSA